MTHDYVRTAQQALDQQRRDHAPGGLIERDRHARALAGAMPPMRKEGRTMKKSEAYPSKWLKPEDIGQMQGDCLTVTIKEVTWEAFKYDGEASRKVTLKFNELEKPWIVGSRNWDAIVAVTGFDDSDRWPNQRITLYRDVYDGNKPCIRVSEVKPQQEDELPLEPAENPAPNDGSAKKAKTAASKAKPKPERDDLDDEVPDFGMPAKPKAA
jgi:hypothetical protein